MKHNRIMRTHAIHAYRQMLTTSLLATALCLMQPMISDTQGQDTGEPNNPATMAQTTPSKLLPEGYMINGLQGRLVRANAAGRWFLLFGDQKDIPKTDPTDPLSVPIEVLPGRNLLAMTEVTANETNLSLFFRVWGRITTYHNRNYILPQTVATVSLFSKNPVTATGTKSSDTNEEKTLATLRDMLTAIPATMPLVPERLRSDRINGHASTNSAGGIPQTRTDPFKNRTALREGTMLVDRTGQIFYDGQRQRWLFLFESSAGRAEQSAILQPCGLLESMEQQFMMSGANARFTISGTITTWADEAYLLPHKVMRTFTSGNFYTQP